MLQTIKRALISREITLYGDVAHQLKPDGLPGRAGGLSGSALLALLLLQPHLLVIRLRESHIMRSEWPQTFNLLCLLT